MSDKPEYRFEFKIVDTTREESVVSGSTYISNHISPYGECESIDVEIAGALRAFKNKLRNRYEEENYSINEVEV